MGDYWKKKRSSWTDLLIWFKVSYSMYIRKRLREGYYHWEFFRQVPSYVHIPCISIVQTYSVRQECVYIQGKKQRASCIYI